MNNQKTTKQRLLTLVSMIFMVSMVNAQQIDEKKMDKDIVISENILSSLIKSHEELMFYSSSPNGTFMSEYGVILKLSGSRSLITEDMKGGFTFDFVTDDFIENQQRMAFKMEKLARVSEERALKSLHEAKEMERVMKNSVVIISDDDEQDEDNDTFVFYSKNHSHEKEAKEKAKYKIKYKEKIKADIEKANALMKEMMIDFLLDYGSLINQLKPEHKIMVVSGGDRNRNFYSGSNSRGSKISVEITKSDLTNYKSGKLSKEKLIEKIKVTEIDNNAKKSADLELLSSIFKRLYQPDLSETYYLSGRLFYERLDGFGVVYNMKVYSSNSNNGKHTIVTLGISGLTQEERNKKVNELYPQFEQELKENILEYGKTLKTLKDKENLMFKVRLTECNKCEMPRSIDVSVSQSVLSDYNSGKLSKSNALKKMTVKRNNR